ncbi:MAG: hypothetical protein COB15_15035 [Flavobacteriales bacterium]|nr:MAG: hypothetical protein COB15_15035 [Flavobacteriales bacterium]
MKTILTTFFLLLFLASFSQVNSNPNKDSIYNNFTPIKLAEIKFNKKAISQFGFGKTTIISTTVKNNYYYSTTSRDTSTLFALTYSTNRWWINKYFAGGWFYDISPNKDGGYAIGPQLTGFAEFNTFILPYCTFASGVVYDVVDSKNNRELKSKLYVPYILKIGTYVFFKKNRGFALFAEINNHLNSESWPNYRIGIAWTKLKR